MTRTEIHDNTLTIHLGGLDRLLAVRRRFEIRTSNIVNVELSRPRGRFRSWMRRVAASIPPVLSPLTFYQQSGRRWRRNSPSEGLIEISLIDERYTRIVVAVDDPQAAVAEIRRACTASCPVRPWRLVPVPAH